MYARFHALRLAVIAGCLAAAPHGVRAQAQDVAAPMASPIALVRPASPIAAVGDAPFDVPAVRRTGTHGTLVTATPHAPVRGAERRRVGSFWKHAGVGLLVGAAIGGGIGLYADFSGDNTFPMTVVTLPLGALVGTVGGGAVWAVRRR